MSQSPLEKYLGSTFTHFLRATLFALCSLSGLMSLLPFWTNDWLIHLQGIAHALVTVGSGKGLELVVFSLQ